MKVNMESLMKGKSVADHALSEVQTLADMLLHARIDFCRLGDSCNSGSASQSQCYDNREVVTRMRAEAFTALAAIERLRALGGEIVVSDSRAGGS